MSMLNWFNKEQSRIEDVLHDARHLRDRYGADAERWVEMGLLGAVGEPGKTHQLKQLKRALRFI